MQILKVSGFHHHLHPIMTKLMKIEVSLFPSSFVLVTNSIPRYDYGIITWHTYSDLMKCNRSGLLSWARFSTLWEKRKRGSSGYCPFQLTAPHSFCASSLFHRGPSTSLNMRKIFFTFRMIQCLM